ncbi:helicase domain protein [Paenibacillus algicola]|uniref:Helicase domain protein n=1 Tax=Paenibacillus algicola TaxID=2565926 RepID=A0A4P8XNV9_9BACL|nr:helicase-related protein [Paenibacillus algicola]QCT04576.1 helicase domain protein [Paenibacillus algicola]
MDAALYAVRLAGGWRLIASLDLRVDLYWWFGSKARKITAGTSSPGLPAVSKVRSHDRGYAGAAKRLVVLSQGLPLGWATAVRDDFAEERGMDLWGSKAWGRYVRSALEHAVGAPLLEASGRGSRALADAPLFFPGDDGLRQLEALFGPREWEGLHTLALQLGGWLSGRALLAGEVEALLQEAGGGVPAGWVAAAQLGELLGRLRFYAGLAAEPAPRSPGWLRRRRARGLRCRRCGSAARGRTACAACGSAACAYCETCLAMGRSRACALLLQGAAQSAVQGTAGGSPTAALGRWGLSAAQSAAAGAALRFLAEPAVPGSAAGRFLIWAVTGAGKTEMIFPLLQSILTAGGRVLVAAPRRDVVLELAPRLAAAFAEQQVVTLYGGSPDRWKQGGITLATTHQLLRFKEAFDLVVIDEIDAFPYHNDPMLDFAAKGACKAGGKYIYLSATPPLKLQQEAAAGRLPHAKVPARFHGHPLPVPKAHRMISVHQCLARRQLPPALLRQLQASIERGAQVFLFLSRIRHIEPFLELLRRSLVKVPLDGTSSVDPERAAKVMAFRQRELRLLVTTTILERGVTVPRSDVFILDADSELFDEAALIQMAGRAGRSKEDPNGKVLFAAHTWTSSQRAACRQIRRMNVIARKGGYLKR